MVREERKMGIGSGILHAGNTSFHGIRREGDKTPRPGILPLCVRRSVALGYDIHHGWILCGEGVAGGIGKIPQRDSYRIGTTCASGCRLDNREEDEEETAHRLTSE